jgi:2-keto-4-pentenoate hydratase/2-oxohepta-3-ene-1,7-dioic acid hydratase in catechol pathway
MGSPSASRIAGPTMSWRATRSTSLPVIATTKNEIADPDARHLELRVNGDLHQSANTSQLIFGVRKLISWVSTWYALHPGDVLMTGTPEGVGPIAGGDIVDASITGLGSMSVKV